MTKNLPRFGKLAIRNKYFAIKFIFAKFFWSFNFNNWLFI